MIGGLGTWSAVLGPAGASNPGYWTTGDQTLPGGAKTFTGGPWTFTRTAVASSAETIATFKVSDDSTSKIEIMNNTASDAVFAPMIKGTVLSTVTGLQFWSWLTSDVGTQPGMLYRVETTAQNALSTRPLYQWNNSGNTVLQMLPLNSGANSCLSWGTQAGGVPAFTTRSNGTRLVLYNSLSGSAVDYAICVDPSNNFSYQTIPQASLTYSHIIYGGTSPAWRVYGDGRMQTYGGRVVKLRVATTTPITVAVTDHVVISQLGTPGAVAVNLPATPATGLEFVIKDGTGDAAANNITITPAAGNIDGAGTLVLAANYAVAKLVYNGTQWNRIGS